MPPDGPISEPDLLDVVEQVGLYPVEAFEFVQAGLRQTVETLKADVPAGESRHVTGQELCLGLRDFAIDRWGMMAGTVLRRWQITSTLDFGKIVFAMIEHGLMSQTDDDTLDDFRDAFDFKKTFDSGYTIACKL